MKPSRPRSFTSAGRISRRTLTVVAVLAGVTALTAVVVAHTEAGEAPGVAVDAARQVLAATEAWQTEHGDGCPTLSELVEDGRLDSDARTDDAWGNRFRIICDGPRTTVRSAGPDGRAGTPDDLKVERSSG
ncbi:MAG TPA: hypothetical protein VF395_22555 [Polyangiaceae bacterium]